jgi:peptide/nickel transport system permease protein
MTNRMAVAGTVLVLLFHTAAALAPVLARYSFDAQLFQRNAGPSAAHWFGTDDLGRDLFARLVFGARLSLTVGIATQFAVLTGGLLLGCLSGYYGGRLDTLLMRLTDVMYAFPSTLLAIALVAVLGRSLFNIIAAIALSMVPNMTRLIRSSVLAVREQEFIEAARAVGATDGRILAHHVLPNILSPVLVAMSFGIPAAMLAEAQLSFIGLGVTPPTPSWGLMVNDGFQWFRSAPLLALVPAAAISLTLVAFNFLGDGLRDALDPKSISLGNA